MKTITVTPNQKSAATVALSVLASVLVTRGVSPTSPAPSGPVPVASAPVTPTERTRGHHELKCKAKDGSHPSMDGVDVTGCVVRDADRPMALIECGKDRTGLVLRHFPGDVLLVIRCSLLQ